MLKKSVFLQVVATASLAIGDFSVARLKRVESSNQGFQDLSPALHHLHHSGIGLGRESLGPATPRPPWDTGGTPFRHRQNSERTLSPCILCITAICFQGF
jgi:hypothetical protein